MTKGEGDKKSIFNRAHQRCGDEVAREAHIGRGGVATASWPTLSPQDPLKVEGLGCKDKGSGFKFGFAVRV